MSEPNSVPQTNAPATTELTKAQADELATLGDVEEIDFGEPLTIPEPPASFDEDLRTSKHFPMEKSFLRINQRRVLDRIMSGSSISKIAEDLQIARTTIYYWMRHDEAFIAAVTAWRRRARQQAADELVVMTERAMSTLRRAVYDGNLQAAALVLKSQGLLERKRPARPRAKKSTTRMTPNVVMEHRRTTVAVSVPTKSLEKREMRQLPEGGQAK